MCLDMISLEITEKNLWDGRREKKGEGNDLNIGAIEKKLSLLRKDVGGGDLFFVRRGRNQKCGF